MRLPPDEARRRFVTSPVARFATVRPEGGPRLVPVAFALVDFGDHDVLVHAVDHKPKATTQLARIGDVRADPRVTLLVDQYDDDWSRLWWARADGLARLVDDGALWQSAVDALQARHEQYRDRPPTGSVIAVTVTRWSGWAAAPDLGDH